MNQSEENKKGIISYLVIGISIVIIAVILIFALGKCSELVTEYANNYYRQFFIDEEPGFSSPWYVKGLHKVDEAFIYSTKPIKGNAVYVVGSSVSSNSIDEETESLDDGYVYRTLVCGNGCHRSNRILINLGREAGLFKLDDIIKYEVSFSTFRDVEKTISETVIDKWGKYSVNDDLSIDENTVFLAPLYAINIELIKIQNTWELITSWWEQTNHEDRYPLPRGYGNFKNNYFNYDAVADSCNYSDKYAESVIEDIDGLHEEYNTVVEISPIPRGLLETEYGQKLNTFIEQELIPHLDENGITYRDLRNDFDDSEFADGVHLSYEAELSYTKQLNEDMNKIIKSIK